MALATANLAIAGADAQIVRALAKPYVGPFPDFPRPSDDECRAVKAALELLHGPVKGRRKVQTLVAPEHIEAASVSGSEQRALTEFEDKQLNDGFKTLTQVKQEGGGYGYRNIKSEPDNDETAERTEEPETSKESSVTTPEVKFSKRVKGLWPVPEAAVVSGAQLKEENLDLPPTLGSNGRLISAPSGSLKALPSLAHGQGSGLQDVKREPLDHRQSHTDGSSLATPLKESVDGLSGKSRGSDSVHQGLIDRPSILQIPGRVLRSQTNRSHQLIAGPSGSADTPLQKDQHEGSGRAGSRKRKSRTVQEPLRVEAPVTPQPLTDRGGASDLHPSGKVNELTSQNVGTSCPRKSDSPLVQASKSLQTPLESGTTSNHRSVLDSLVRTILSQNTTDINSERAFASLKQAFPTWEDVRAAGAGPLAASIKSGGLAEIKARRILDILDSLAARHGALELEHLRSMSDEQVKAELSQFKGVGPKTVACVLMFCLGRHEFPVDTHVWRISKRLGWVPQNADREATYEHLNQRVPDDVKYDLHCLLVGHGKKCPGCAKGGKPRQAPDGPCPLTPWIRGAGKGSQK